ncbi:EI24 domain-containing protein [Sphingobium estronivorans]|uniref:EI24 domain-containing protein n=1 Tax=Sphingobium estronivorans TaxID=1577690 RepID=UPI001239FE00|nr:EI24 domain-containing protein [Sphingobium estronivorans]
MILRAAFRALPSIFHGAALRLLLKTLLLTLFAFALLAAALWGGIHAARLHFGWGATAGWSGLAEAAATTLAMLAAAWLLFRAVAMAIMTLFADDIIVAVERDSYPQAAARACPVGWGRSLHFALRSLARTLGWNLIALPAYVLLLVTGIGTIGLFLVLNAYLLGRDLSDMVEPRQPDLPPIPRGSRWLMGLVSALIFLVPVLNLLAPIWSAAMAVHMLHGRQRNPA